MDISDRKIILSETTQKLHTQVDESMSPQNVAQTMKERNASQKNLVKIVDNVLNDKYNPVEEITWFETKVRSLTTELNERNRQRRLRGQRRTMEKEGSDSLAPSFEWAANAGAR